MVGVLTTVYGGILIPAHSKTFLELGPSLLMFYLQLTKYELYH
jgi:hypothetical protein